MCVYIYVAFIYITEKGPGRELVGGKDGVLVTHTHNGGRGRAGAGKRGKTVCLLYYIYITKEGARQELVGRERQKINYSTVICICILIIYDRYLIKRAM